MLPYGEDPEVVLARFNKLIQEFMRGSMARNSFRPWEIELLLDIGNCDLREADKRETLRRYQRAVQRQMEKGASRPMVLSEYLEFWRARRAARAAEAAATEPLAARR